MNVTVLYKRYFQKSRAFLYPLLGIKKGAYSSPEQTYVGWKDNFQPEDFRLVCRYSKSRGLPAFEKSTIYTNPHFEKSIEFGPEKMVYVFNYTDCIEDWNNFLRGRYSRLTRRLALAIRTYYGALTPEWAYMETYLFPGKYRDLYTGLLFDKEEREFGEDILSSVGELCDKPDLVRETLMTPTEVIATCSSQET